MQPVKDAANKRPQSNRHDPAKPVTIVARVAEGDRAVINCNLGSGWDYWVIMTQCRQIALGWSV